MWPNCRNDWGLCKGELSCQSQTHSLVEADNGPQTAAHRTATTQAAAEKPLHVHWQVLLQAGVHSADAGFEFLRRYLKQRKREKDACVVALRGYGEGTNERERDRETMQVSLSAVDLKAPNCSEEGSKSWRKNQKGRSLQMLSRYEISKSYTTDLLTGLQTVQGEQAVKAEISSEPVAALAKQLEWMLIPRRVCTP